MNIVEFKQDIVSGNLKPVYIISGEELGMINFYINQIKKTVVRETSVASVWTQLTNKGLVKNDNVYVIRDDKEFQGNKTMWSKLSRVKYGTLIYLVTKVDTRTEFYKSNKDIWMEFPKLSTAQLYAYFSGKYTKFSKPEIEYAIELCENDFTRIDNELDKIHRIISDFGNFYELCDYLIYTQETQDIFATSNLITKGYIDKAFENVTILLNNGENVMGILTMIFNTFTNAAKVLGSHNPTEESIGIKKGQITSIKNNFAYTLDSAFEGMEITFDCIQGIKSGKYTDKMAIQMALFKLNALQ